MMVVAGDKTGDMIESKARFKPRSGPRGPGVDALEKRTSTKTETALVLIRMSMRQPSVGEKPSPTPATLAACVAALGCRTGSARRRRMSGVMR